MTASVVGTLCCCSDPPPEVVCQWCGGGLTDPPATVHVEITNFSTKTVGFTGCYASEVLEWTAEADLALVPGRANNTCLWEYVFDPPLLLDEVQHTAGSGCSIHNWRRWWLERISLRISAGAVPTDGGSEATNVPVLKAHVYTANTFAFGSPPGSPPAFEGSAEVAPNYPGFSATWGFKACGGGGAASVYGTYERDGLVDDQYFEAEVTVPS